MFSHPVISDSLQPHELRHAKLPGPFLSPRVCSNSMSIESMMPSNHLILYCPLLLLPSVFPTIRVFSCELALYISFKISPSNSKESACNAGDQGSIPGLGRSPGEGNGNSLQYSCLENPMDKGAWQATVHRVTKSQTPLSNQHFHFHPEYAVKPVIHGRHI